MMGGSCGVLIATRFFFQAGSAYARLAAISKSELRDAYTHCTQHSSYAFATRSRGTVPESSDEGAVVRNAFLLNSVDDITTCDCWCGQSVLVGFVVPNLESSVGEVVSPRDYSRSTRRCH